MKKLFIILSTIILLFSLLSFNTYATVLGSTSAWYSIDNDSIYINIDITGQPTGYGVLIRFVKNNGTTIQQYTVNPNIDDRELTYLRYKLPIASDCNIGTIEDPRFIIRVYVYYNSSDYKYFYDTLEVSTTYPNWHNSYDISDKKYNLTYDQDIHSFEWSKINGDASLKYKIAIQRTNFIGSSNINTWWVKPYSIYDSGTFVVPNTWNNYDSIYNIGSLCRLYITDGVNNYYSNWVLFTGWGDYSLAEQTADIYTSTIAVGTAINDSSPEIVQGKLNVYNFMLLPLSTNSGGLMMRCLLMAAASMIVVLIISLIKRLH